MKQISKIPLWRKVLFCLAFAGIYLAWLLYFDLPVGPRSIGAQTGRRLLEEPSEPFFQELGHFVTAMAGLAVGLVILWIVRKVLFPRNMDKS